MTESMTDCTNSKDSSVPVASRKSWVVTKTLLGLAGLAALVWYLHKIGLLKLWFWQ